MSKNMITPFYCHSRKFAEEHGQLNAYRTSLRANQSCKEAIERAIRKHFDGMHLDEAAVTEVVQEFGSERVFYILANTVQLKSWDGRFSGKNRQVLLPVPMIDAEETRLTYAVASHSAVLDGFISQFFRKFKENM